MQTPVAESLIRAAAGLLVFRLGLAALGAICRAAAESRRGCLAALTGSGGVRAAAVGAVAAAAVQSSGAVTAVTVQAAGAGLFDLRTAICLVLGANVGTTVTAHLVAFEAQRVAPLLVLGGALAFAVAGRCRAPSRGLARLVSATASAGGLMLFGLGEISEGAGCAVASTPIVVHLARGALSPATGTVAGLVVSAVTTSSTLATGIVVSLCESGAMGLRSAVPVILGANVGTCATAWLAAAGAGPAGRRVAAAHLIFNVLSAAVCLLSLDAFVSVVEAVGGSEGRMAATAHTLFNLLGVAIALPVAERFARLVEGAVR